MAQVQDAAFSPLPEIHEGGALGAFINRFRSASRLKRVALFRGLFEVGPETRILDLGGSTGVHVHALLAGTPVLPANVHVADIDREALAKVGQFGYVPVALEPGGPLPFEDGAFDIVLCSSVLEHVTIPAAEIWTERSGARFRERARLQQHQFARELARVARGYFVQVPSRWFPLETHSWLPFLSYLPRRLQMGIIAVANRVWIKRTVPDFHLPTAREMRWHFPGAELIRERMAGVTKSLIAVKRS